ncbi:MAG: hypothetical protein AAF991_11185, partial [Pseudomonadota bacterium]
MNTPSRVTRGSVELVPSMGLATTRIRCWLLSLSLVLVVAVSAHADSVEVITVADSPTTAKT